MSKAGTGQKSKKNKQEEKQELDIESIPINDDNWKCIVGLLIERRPRYMVHIKQINEAVHTGLRRVMKCITDDDITKDVKQLRTGKSSGSKTALTANAHQKLCDEAYQHLILEENIPPLILSRLIKFAILRMKANDISRKEAEFILAQEIQEESKLMMEGKSPSLGGAVGGGAAGGSGSSVKKSTLGQQTAYIGKEKKGTKLRKRGQEWMDIQFIDDAPRQGADLYIVLTGFYDCELPIELLKIGIPLFGIIRLQREDEDDSDVDSLDQIETVKNKLESIMSFDRDTASLHNEVTNKVTEIKTFWKNFRTMEFNPSFIEIFKDVAFMTLLPPPDTDLNDNIEDIEITKELLYRSLSYLMYDLQDTMRQHDHYLKNMKVQRYTSEGDWNLHRMTMYRSILRDVPHECVSVPLIVHAFMQEVIYFEAADGKLPMNDFIRRGSMVRSIDLRDIVKVSLERTIEELNIIHGIKEKLPEAVEYQDPLIIIHGDEVLMKTFHCEFPNFNIPEITCNILKNIIPVKLWNYFPRHEVNSHTTHEKQYFKLKYCMEDEKISTKTLYNYMYVLLFDQMTCRRTEDVVALDKETTMSFVAQPSRISTSSVSTSSNIWTKAGTRSTSYFRFFKRMQKRYTFPQYIISDVQCLGGLRGICTFVHKIKHKTVHCCDCYRFVEDMSVNVMLQALQVAFSTFSCWEHRYCAFTDTLLLRFHHPVDKDGFFEDSYRITIRTPVPLRDFFKHVADDEWEWIAKEEDLYQKKLEEMDNNRFSSTCPDNKEEIQAKCNISSRSVPPEEYLIIGSIKHEIFLKEQEEAQRQAEEAEIAKRQEELKGKKREKKEGKDFETNQNRESTKGKGDKKTRIEALESAGDYGFGENEQDLDSGIKEDSYEFEGYDLGSTLFQIRGRTTRFYSIDESKVEVNACSCLYRWKLLTLKITKSGHTLVFKTYLSAPPPNVVPVTVHVVLKSGIVIAVGKPTIQRFLENGTETTNEAPRKVSFQSGVKYISGYDMILSLPSGLVVETIKEPPLPFYIKQTYLSMGPECANILDEQYRCYLQSGHVLKFMKNGNVEILSADSSMINCIDIAAVAEDTIAAMMMQVRESPTTFTEETPAKVTVEEKKSEETRPKSKAKKGDSKSNFPSDGTKKSGKKKLRISEHNTFLDDIVENERPTSENKIDENIPQELPALEVRDYQAITADGWQFIVKGGVSEFRKIILRTTSDLEEDEIFTRREDYTNTLLQADGSLVVSFIDGTRITTKLNISNKMVYCEWTGEEEETFQKLMETEELEMKPMTEGYTLVTLSYLMEHQNFATVAYGQNGLLGELSIPQTNTTIEMLPNGTYEIRMSGNTELSIGNEIISFIHFDSKRSKVLCRSDVHVRGLVHDEDITEEEYAYFLLSTTRTIDGKKFEVFYDGNTQLQRNEKRSKYNFGYRIPVRWFVLQRDLSGLEIVHEDDVNSLLADIAKHHKAVTVTDKFPSDQELQYHIAMCPVDKNESQRWLADYRPVKITAKERRTRSHLKRSTYGDPPSWFHPFPKTPRVGDAAKEKCANTPVSLVQKDEEEEQNIFCDDEEDIPDVMVVRMIREIAPAGVSIMNCLKEGLSRFRQLDDEKFDFDSLYHSRDYDMEFKTLSSQRRMVKHKVHWQDRTTPAAKELYLLGLRRKHKLTDSEIRTIKERDVNHIVNMAIILSRKKRWQRSLDELRTALRYHIVPPYFSSPLGEAFLLVKEALDRSVDEAKNEPCEECEECSCAVDIGTQVDE